MDAFDGDGVGPAEGAMLAEADGCWVGEGAGEALGLPDWSGPPGVAGGEPYGR